MSRACVETAEALLDKWIPVLNHGGITLVDYMGNDKRIADFARKSYAGEATSEKEISRLINFMMREWHTSPFESVHLVFHIKCPIFVFQQWVRHRTARLNVLSGRYAKMPAEFYVPELDAVNFQSESNKQGRGEIVPLEQAKIIVARFEEVFDHADQVYTDAIGQNVAKELSRIVLPMAQYTAFYWENDLHNIFSFLRLRLDQTAQYEIRCYAQAMANCVKAVVPVAYEAFEEYILGSISFSRTERSALALLLNGQPHGLTGRSAEIFEEKIKSLAS